MSRKLPPTASVADPVGGAKLAAPSAFRNAGPLTRLLAEHAPKSGRALEIASGTGQHVISFARALPGLHWQPTDVEPARLASIDAYAAEAGLSNIAPARNFDATAADWSAAEGPLEVIVLVNLLHLISRDEAQTVVREAVRALAPGGTFFLYGPFKRGGILISDGDATFDAQLRASDPAIGYKDVADVTTWCAEAAQCAVWTLEMPANHLAFVITRQTG